MGCALVGWPAYPLQSDSELGLGMVDRQSDYLRLSEGLSVAKRANWMRRQRSCLWSGEDYVLEAKRAALPLLPDTLHFTLKNALQEILILPGLKVKMPTEAANHMLKFYDTVQDWIDCFEREDDWIKFQSRLCNDYCEFYILGRRSEKNHFCSLQMDVTGTKNWFALYNIAKEYQSFRIQSAKIIQT